jgi:hypothetical protein
MKKENAYFAELDRIARDFEQRHEAHKKLKQQIIDTKGWDSEELKAWYAEEENDFQYPISQGACKAYRAFLGTLEHGEDEIEMNDFLWDREIDDFVEALRKAGFDSFIYTNQSTAVMENLYGFAKAGCTMTGLTTITRRERRFGEYRDEAILGIHFTL